MSDWATAGCICFAGFLSGWCTVDCCCGWIDRVIYGHAENPHQNVTPLAQAATTTPLDSKRDMSSQAATPLDALDVAPACGPIHSVASASPLDIPPPPYCSNDPSMPVYSVPPPPPPPPASAPAPAPAPVSAPASLSVPVASTRHVTTPSTSSKAASKTPIASPPPPRFRPSKPSARERSPSVDQDDSNNVSLSDMPRRRRRSSSSTKRRGRASRAHRDTIADDCDEEAASTMHTAMLNAAAASAHNDNAQAALYQAVFAASPPQPSVVSLVSKITDMAMALETAASSHELDAAVAVPAPDPSSNDTRHVTVSARTRRR